MEVGAGVHRNWENPFCLEEGKLRKIVEVLREHGEKKAIPEISYRVDRADQSYYEPPDVDQIFMDDNIPGREIRSISISLTLKNESHGEQDAGFVPYYAGGHASVTFQASETPRVQLSVSHSDRDWCFLLADELDAQIGRVVRKRTVLDRIPKREADFVLLFVVFLLIFGFFGWRASLSQYPNLESIKLDSRKRCQARLCAFALPHAASQTDGRPQQWRSGVPGTFFGTFFAFYDTLC